MVVLEVIFKVVWIIVGIVYLLSRLI
jgi:hypothetical protein